MQYKITDNFDANQLNNFVNEKVITSQIKDILVSKNYLTNLNKLVDTSNIITVNNNGKYLSSNNSSGSVLDYNGDDNQSLTTNALSSSEYKAWTISHWYWFGYWKLCFNHPLSQKIANILLKKPSSDDIAASLEPYTDDSSPSGTANALAAFLIVQGLIIQDNDFGQGVWIGFWTIIPDMGWGSLGGDKNSSHSFPYNRLFWDHCGGWGHQLYVYHNETILDYTDYGTFANYIKLHPQFEIPDYAYSVYCVGGSNMVEKHLYNSWTNWSTIKFNGDQLLGSYTGKYFLAKYFTELHLTWLNKNNKITMQYYFEANNADCLHSTAAWVSYTKIEFQ